MEKLSDLQKVKVLEIITIVATLAGIALSIIHGNQYDFVFNLFSIENVIHFRLHYVSLFLYSILALVIFVTLYLFNEKNPEIRFLSYIQGWLLITMAAASYEWFYSIVNQSAKLVLTKQVVQDPFTLYAKGASVIFFGALFVFWMLEKRKHQNKILRPV